MPDPQTLGQTIAETMPALAQPGPLADEPPFDPEDFRRRFQAAAEQAGTTTVETTEGTVTVGVSQAPDAVAEVAPAPLDNLTYLLRQRAELTVRMAELGQRRDDIDQVIKEEMGDAQTGTVAGRQVVHYTNVVTNRVDLKVLKERYPTIAAECTRATGSRRFTVDAAAVLGGGQ